ncbi:Alginate biosynthesis protein AlgX precursor [compost metagenome]
MMALLDNGCEGKDAQMSASTTLKPGKNELMVNSKNLNLQNSSHQVDIRFADTSVKTLQATLWYMNGRHEDIKIDKPETSDTDGRFAFELRTDEDWASQNLLAVEIQGPEKAGAAPQKVEAKICKRNVFPSAEQRTASAGQ